MGPSVVEAIVVIATVLILVWDLYLYKDSIPGNTITQVVIRRTKSRPLIPFLCGLLMGHWFW